MTYDELLQQLAALLNRTDLAYNLPTFIALCEAGFAAPAEFNGIRHWRMEQRSEVTTQEQYLSLPDGWLETIRMHNQDTGMRMDLMSRQRMQELREANPNATPQPIAYRHQGDTYALYPTPTSTMIELEYYARVPRLNKKDYGVPEPIQSNWISELYPDIYLYGAALHSAPYLHDDARIQTWRELYSTAVARLNAEAQKGESSGSSLRLARKGMAGTWNPNG